MMKRIPTNYMITKVSERFGYDSKEAMLMRFKVRSYVARMGGTYDECEEIFNELMKKKVR